jgi:hypothetical protein
MAERRTFQVKTQTKRADEKSIQEFLESHEAVTEFLKLVRGGSICIELLLLVQHDQQDQQPSIREVTILTANWLS